MNLAAAINLLSRLAREQSGDLEARASALEAFAVVAAQCGHPEHCALAESAAANLRMADEALTFLKAFDNEGDGR